VRAYFIKGTFSSYATSETNLCSIHHVFGV
jgi:hypothetical protein